MRFLVPVLAAGFLAMPAAAGLIGPDPAKVAVVAAALDEVGDGDGLGSLARRERVLRGELPLVVSCRDAVLRAPRERPDCAALVETAEDHARAVSRARRKALREGGRQGVEFVDRILGRGVGH